MTLISDLRVDIGDDGTPQRLTDSQYIAIIAKAARRLNRELSLSNGEAIVVDASGDITSSDPDSRYYDLVLLQAECMIAKREFNTELAGGGAGIYVNDGEQTLDNRNAAQARTSFFNSENSPCEELKEAIDEYKLDRSADFGKCIW
jgi:hypothetical protein